ncbi:MAG: ABC transporter ATP-binding protein [Syntrophomonadaceae bacterium]|nr:ABC transporter ATP-binding protein [Syntrophomonadaceae bacterium]
MIRTVNLSKKFGNLVAVDNLCLEVAPGELFGFLGPNGAGKTTTIKMLVGMLTPTSGEAYLSGLDVYRHPIQAKALLGYVPDQPNLYEKLTPIEFLTFIADLYQMEYHRAQKGITQWLEVFDLADRSQELMGGFSHGMKQKVALAAALLHEPHVLFLDEPTVGLDPASARSIKDILKQLCSQGVTVFMSTHILEIAERMCDRVGIIQKGHLVAVGNMEQLKALTVQKDRRFSGTGITLEDLFLELTGGAHYEELSRHLED